METSNSAQTQILEWDESGHFDCDPPFDEMTDFAAEAFDGFLQQLEDILFGLSKSGSLFVEAKNLGWRKLSGQMDVTVISASDFIQKVFPKTQDWSFVGGYDHQMKCFCFTLYHHDSPSGETYKVSSRE